MRWVALLRAVNLGVRNKVPMAELRRVLEGAGFGSVRTYIASGNVIFDHARPDAREIERAIIDAFGVETVAVLRRPAQLRTLVDEHPFGVDTSRSHALFLAGKPTAARLRELAEVDVGADRFEAVGPDLVLHLPELTRGARLTAALVERRLGVPATLRNWRTVTKLLELVDE